MSTAESSALSSQGNAPRHGRRPPPGTRRKSQSPNALTLAEEAFHLLRTIPLAHLFLYYVGTIPLVIGAFFFWADMSRSSYAAQDAAIGAAGLVAAFLWAKFWQGLFCRRLWHQLHPSGTQVALSPARYFRNFSAQALIQSVSLPLHLVSFLFVPWPLAFFQNASVLAFTQDYGRSPLRRTMADSARFAHRNWLQNYLVLILVLVLALFIWINVLGAAILIPMGLKVFLGIESIFTLSPESAILNTTFLFGTLLLSFLFIDPFLKSIYTLRCFREQSRSTGADLISRIDRLESEIEPTSARLPAAFSTRSAGVILPLAILLSGLIASPLHASDLNPPSGSPTPEALEKSIETTLQKKAYQWRLPRQVTVDDDANKGWLAGAMDDLTQSIERRIKKLSQGIDDFFRKLFKGKQGSSSGSIPGGGGSGAGIGLLAKLIFVLVVAVLVIWIGYRIVSESRRQTGPADDDLLPVGPIDLESDEIVATQLPEDEWMKLAREQISKGEHRLAVRALFLAGLANLGDRGLLRVARFKSNRDYTRELDLKARSRPELQSAFQENVGLFERVWYGLHEISREAIDRFTTNYERITHESAPVDSDSNSGSHAGEKEDPS